MDFRGVVFDIPLETKEIFTNFEMNYPENMEINGFQISKAKILPEFFDHENDPSKNKEYRGNKKEKYINNSFSNKSYNQKNKKYKRDYNQ